MIDIIATDKVKYCVDKLHMHEHIDVRTIVSYANDSTISEQYSLFMSVEIRKKRILRSYMLTTYKDLSKHLVDHVHGMSINDITAIIGLLRFNAIIRCPVCHNVMNNITIQRDGIKLLSLACDTCKHEYTTNSKVIAAVFDDAESTKINHDFHTTSKQHFIRKYGQDADAKWSNYRAKINITKERYINKYNGDTKRGIAEFKRITEKRKLTLANFIKRYGEVDGPRLYKEHYDKIKHTLANFIKRYGEVDGPRLHKEHYARRAPTKDNFIDWHNGDVEAGMTAYYNRIDKISGHGAGYSKEATSYFEAHVIPHLPASSVYMYKDNEKIIGLTSDEREQFMSEFGHRRSCFSFDFCCNDLKLIIDFHGIAYHYHPSNTKPLAFMSDDLSKRLDDYRKTVAEQHGYAYVAVYSHEAYTDSTKQMLIHTIQEQIQHHE